MKILILAETNGQEISEKTLPAIAMAQQIAPDNFHILAIGNNLQGIEKITGFGAQTAWKAEHPDLAKPLADKYAVIVAEAAKQTGAEMIAGTTSTFTRDVLARAAALLDVPMLSDVMSISTEGGPITVKRPIYSANLIGTFAVDAPRFILTARGPAWGKPHPASSSSDIQTLSLPGNLPNSSEWLNLAGATQSRPDLTQARVVVSGGRPLKDPATFEQHIGGLADVLGGACGATRAAVDSGIAANELQVGQTGKTVAPELYIAVAVSGSVQHLAGMKDSKVIVAINIDPEAPIFGIADYGLVADLYEVVPQLINELKPVAGM